MSSTPTIVQMIPLRPKTASFASPSLTPALMWRNGTPSPRLRGRCYG